MPTRAATPRTAAPMTAPIIILSGSCGPPSDACAIARIADELFEHHPCRLQQRECDEANHGSHRYEQWIVHFPEEQNRQRRHRDESGQPVADGDLSEQDAGAQDRSDRGAIGTLYEALDIGIASVMREKRGGHQHEDEGWEKDSDRRDERSPKAGDQVANEGGGDHHRAGADHPDRNRDEELPRIEPAIFSHEPLLEEWHDHEAAAERERTGLEKEK